MISDKMAQAINRQIAAEFHSAYIYLSLSGYFADKGFGGIASWLRIQSEEEVEHATKLFDYILSQNRCPELQTIPAIPATEGSVKDIFTLILNQEENVTKMIRDLYELAQEEKDYGSGIFLQWYITEQIEEENQVRDILDKIEIIGKHDGTGLLGLDSFLGQRKPD